MPAAEEIMRVIAENLPSPYEMDMVWRQTNDGAEFDGKYASQSEEWKSLAAAVASLFNAK